MNPMQTRARAPLAALAAMFVLTACGGGGGGSPAPAPTPPTAAPSPTPSLKVTADSADASPDGSPVPLHAIVTASSAVPAWTLDGPGTLSAATGADISYVPPSGESAVDGGTATITIAATGLTTQTVKITLAAAPDVPGRHWTSLRTPGVRWRNVVTDGSLYVALGDRGQISTSPDGKTWTSHATGENDVLSVAAHGPAGWLVLGVNHSVVRSPDGVTWTPAPFGAGTTSILSASSLVAGNGHYVAAGNYASAQTDDGVTWNPITPRLMSVAFGNGVFVAVDSALHVVHSTDGLHWDAASVPGNFVAGSNDELHNVAFAHGQFLVAGFQQTASSTDGIAWTTSAGPNTGAIWGASDVFFAVCPSPLWGNDLCLTSDGTQWDHNQPINITDPTAAVAGDANTWVRVSRLGGIEWTPQLSGPWNQAIPDTNGYLRGIDYVAGRYVAISSIGRAISSTDAQTWDSAYMAPFSPVTSPIFSPFALTHRGGVLVAGGLRGTDANAPSGGRFVTSADGGLNWTVTAEVAKPVRAIVDDGQRFVAVGDGGQVWGSTNGVAWNSLATVAGGPTLTSVAHGAGTYVAVGPAGTLATSPDGASWTLAAPTGDDGLYNFATVLYDGKQFVRVGAIHNFPSDGRAISDGIVQTSVDGLQWTTQGGSPDFWCGLAFHDGEYVLLTTDGRLLSSRDLKTWTKRVETSGSSVLSENPPSGYDAAGLAWGPDLEAVAFVNGQFMAVGANEMILGSSR